MTPNVNSAIAAIAELQHGNVTCRQLLELGLSPGAIGHRVNTGRLHRVFAGVYAVGRRPITPVERASAAVLACGAGAVLSHGSAATLWEIDAHWRGPVEVTACSARRRRGIVVHRSRTLADADVTEHFGIAVTSPARTVLDIAPRLTDAVLIHAVNDQRLNGYLTLTDLEELLGRLSRHAGARRLKPFVADMRTAAPTRSHFEDAFLAFARRYGFPRPEVNQRVAGHLVDMLFPDAGLVVELDGYEYHGDRASFEDNRDRDADLLAAGLRTVRITWDRLEYAPDREAARLKQILPNTPPNLHGGIVRSATNRGRTR